jgi:hypothetical protein
LRIVCGKDGSSLGLRLRTGDGQERFFAYGVIDGAPVLYEDGFAWLVDMSVIRVCFQAHRGPGSEDREDRRRHDDDHDAEAPKARSGEPRPDAAAGPTGAE